MRALNTITLRLPMRVSNLRVELDEEIAVYVCAYIARTEDPLDIRLMNIGRLNIYPSVLCPMIVFRVGPLSGSLVTLLNDGLRDLGVGWVLFQDILDGVVELNAQLDIEVAICFVAKQLIQDLNSVKVYLSALKRLHSRSFTHFCDILAAEKLPVVFLHVGQDVAERRVLRFVLGQDELIGSAVLRTRGKCP